MVKADDKVEFEEVGKPEKFTNFEELKKTVEILKEVVNKHAEILEENNLVITSETIAPYFDEDKLYRELEEESK